MKLRIYYGNAVIYPALFVIFFSLINAVLYNLKNDSLADSSAVLMAFAPPVIFSLLMCTLALTIFLNKLKNFRKNLIYNILTWFLLPFAYLAVIYIHDLQTRAKFEFRFGGDFFHLLIVTLPFVIGLGLTFIKYRKELRIL